MPKVIYKDDNLEPTGERDVEITEPVIDEIISFTDIPAEIVLDQNFPHIEQLEIINLLDYVKAGKELDAWHLSVDVSVPEIDIDSMWFQFNLLYDLIEQDKEKLALALKVEFVDVRGYVDLPKGKGMFQWINIRTPSFIISKPLDKKITYSDVAKDCTYIETWISSRINDVVRLAKNVKSLPQPKYDSSSKSVFICHSSRDKNFARQLSKALKERSVDVWLDEEKVLVGQDFVKQLENGIRESDFVVLILSPNFVNQGPWAQEEFRMALSRQIAEQKTRILPVLKKDCDIPDILRTKHYADFRKNFDIGFNSLILSINRLV